MLLFALSLLLPARAFCAAAPVAIAPTGVALPTMPSVLLQAPLSAPLTLLPAAPMSLAPASLRTLPQLAPVQAQAVMKPATPLHAQPAPAFIQQAVPAKMLEAVQAPQAQQPASSERGHLDASILFDGALDRKAAPAVPALPYSAGIAAKTRPSGWTAGTLQSSDGATLSFKLRKAEGPGKAPAVYVGGLALAESYDSLFERQEKPASDQYFLWLRGHSPSEWKHTKTVYDQDAKDLARMINLAAERSGSGRVDLVLHSYSVLVFQKMLQLGKDAEVRQALEHLKGARVTLLMPTTHYGDSETAAGEQYAQMAKVIRALMEWLDTMDSWAELWAQTARLNPMMAPQIYAGLAAWQAQREAVLALASKGAVDELKKHLAEPWDPAIDHIRQDLLERVARNSARSGWQEALLKRANDTSRLDFTKADVERMRRLGVRLDLVHSHDDQLIPWVSAKLLFDLLGIASPDKVPPVGTVLESPDKLFHVTIVDGDHYFPLKKPAEMEDHLR